MTARTVKDYRQQALQYLVPALGKRKIRDVTCRDVEAMIEPLPKVQRNRVLALVARLFTLFETWERRHHLDQRVCTPNDFTILRPRRPREREPLQCPAHRARRHE